MRESVPQLIKLIKANEGFSSFPYKDTVGKITIGYGRNLTDVGISRAEAEHLFNQDLSSAIKHAQSYEWFEGLSIPRQAVIVDMLFNLGPARFARFKKMIAAIEREDHPSVVHEMLDSRWATQVRNRAEKLSRMWREDRWLTK